MKSPVNYTRYYFPNGLRWTLLILLLPLAIFLLFISWFITALICIVIVTILWSFKFVTSIDLKSKTIRDNYYRFWIPFGEHYTYDVLNNLFVTKEQKGYKAATRSRDYWVNYNEYTLYLRYDDNKQLPLFTMNEHEPFKNQVEKFSKNLGLNVETH